QKTIDVVEGYSAARRRSVFVGAGGFDEALAAADDVELSFRLAKGRKRLVFAPKAIVYHVHGATLRHYVGRKIRDGLWRSVVYARHPDKLTGTSQAPVGMRTQVPLATLAVASLLAGTRWRRALPVAGLLLAAFTTTTVPAAWRSRRAGADVALASPALSFARGVSLGIGAAIGGSTVLGQKAAQLLGRLRH